MEAPALPRTVDDLAEWSVYADHLQTIGDPLGERLAIELAHPGDAPLEEFASFSAQMARHCPTGGRTMWASWTLGFIRVLELRAKGNPMADAVSDLQHVEEGTLARARDMLRSREGSRLEALVLPAPHVDQRHYRRVFAALPPSCFRVTLTHEQPAPEGVEMLLDCLPPTVTELVLAIRRWTTVAPRFFHDRFATVELARVTTPVLDNVLPALAGTSRVRVRINRVHGPLAPRCELGRPEDAAIVRVDPRSAWCLERDWFTTTRAGIVPIRRLLRGDSGIKEVHLGADPEVASPRVTLMRTGGEWTVKCGDPLRLDGRPIAPKTVAPIRDGARFEVGGRSAVFLSSRVDVQARALLGSTS